MTERRAHALGQESSALVIGPNVLRWDGDALLIDVAETGVPITSPIRGRIRLTPRCWPERDIDLDAAGLHRWRPLAPSARIDVNLSEPELRWSGEAYLDSNSGDEPLEASMKQWDWSRGKLRDGTMVVYECVERSGNENGLALHFTDDGDVTAVEPPRRVDLPRTGWRIERRTRSDDGIANVERTLEDTPFYARSVISSHLLGQPTTSMHESLNLDRFRSPVVQAMLRFRMRRDSR